MHALTPVPGLLGSVLLLRCEWHDTSLKPLSMAVCLPPVATRNLQDYYEMGDVLGNGGFGSVYSGRCVRTGQTVGGTFICGSRYILSNIRQAITFVANKSSL